MRDQAPAGLKSRAVRGADENVVVEIPDRGLAAAGIIKHVIRLAVPIEIGSPRQLPSACNRRAKGASDKRNSR